MNKFCASCHHKFQKEPGFFVGAMYVSYALGIAEVLATFFVLGLFFEKTFDLRMLPIIATVIVLLTFFNVRFSRMIWMYLFKN
ncbi:hypothetical protein [Flavicella sediminum]|uniref:hypothetical protein n=1 Tax=Flavicella sediminum TaxID=2585141 RepID=UPI001FB78B4D|nr:hypothetical protein [Flavicella sediminum]